jgi:hypothetical protein
MALNYRKRIQVFPGLTLNLSKSGVSTTVGRGGASVNIGKRGTYLNTGIPGTGIYSRQRIGGGSSDATAGGSASDPAAEAELWLPDYVDDIESADPDALTAEGLENLRDALNAAQQEQADRRRLQSILRQEMAKVEQQRKRLQFPLWAWLFRGKIAQMTESLDKAAGELERTRPELVSVNLTFQLDEELLARWQAIVDAFLTMADGWLEDVTGLEEYTGKKRPGGNTALATVPVQAYQGAHQLVEVEAEGLHLENANGGDFYLLPGVVLLWDARGFAVLDWNELELKVTTTEVPRQHPPEGAEVTGETWAYANKDGSRDARYSDNFRIPLVRMADLWFRTGRGLDERYLASDIGAAEAFSAAVHAYQEALPETSVGEKTSEE